MTAARNDQEPAPGSRMFVFFPNQPSPARWATGRSARWAAIHENPTLHWPTSHCGQPLDERASHVPQDIVVVGAPSVARNAAARVALAPAPAGSSGPDSWH